MQGTEHFTEATLITAFTSLAIIKKAKKCIEVYHLHMVSKA